MRVNREPETDYKHVGGHEGAGVGRRSAGGMLERDCCALDRVGASRCWTRTKYRTVGSHNRLAAIIGLYDVAEDKNPVGLFL